MTDRKKRCYSMIMPVGMDDNHMPLMLSFFVLIVLCLFFCISAVPAGSTEVQPLTLLYFGCQDGYLKPCG